jgi:hypothetical protein
MLPTILSVFVKFWIDKRPSLAAVLCAMLALSSFYCGGAETSVSSIKQPPPPPKTVVLIGADSLAGSPTPKETPAAAWVIGESSVYKTPPDLQLYRWVDEPVNLYALGEQLMVTDGKSIGMLDGNALYQDGVVSFEFDKDAKTAFMDDIVSIVGTWTGDVWMLRESKNSKDAGFRLYTWYHNRWLFKKSVKGPQTPVLVQRGAGTGMIESLNADLKTCDVAIHNLVSGSLPYGIEYSVQNLPRQKEILGIMSDESYSTAGWGKACDAPMDLVIQRWAGNMVTQSRVFSNASVTASGMAVDGTAWFAIESSDPNVKPQTSIWAMGENRFEQVSSMDGRIVSLVPSNADQIIAIHDPGGGALLKLLKISSATQEPIRLDPKVGEPFRLTRHGKTLWVQTSNGLFASRPPRSEWNWIHIKEWISSVTNATNFIVPPDRRPEDWSCPEGPFVLVDKTDKAASLLWQTLRPLELPAALHGLEVEERLRRVPPGSNREQEYAAPSVVRELNTYFFGIRIVGSDDFLSEQMRRLWERTDGRFVRTVLCARPLSFPMLQIRALAEQDTKDKIAQEEIVDSAPDFFVDPPPAPPPIDTRPRGKPSTGCLSDDDCRLFWVHTCAEIRRCACDGEGKPKSLPIWKADPEQPRCGGRQRPCTPQCRGYLLLETDPPYPRAACVKRRCKVVYE